ncbi:hypothetical protein FFWV33_11140 [Flavobacterium faecale]|uniref:Uncharacterized protein n=1 Tax=Flavobacterium faecale TaxID=1355330 RepID=A0A2S1LED9_9FLAO|nr:CIA30 family protein [Flavobacterium faecale]AWG22031.1 hypothetical protein FFWV33_11140 [Flavobacterium faecale]
MINTLKYTLILLLTFASFTSCQNDEAVTATVDAMVAEPGDALNQSLPGKKIRVEGQGLGGLKKITLDGKVNVPFNPNYNSDQSFIFSIPFDDKLGSRFGLQKITFETANGSVTKDFTILQPVPTVESTVPVVPTPGFPLEIVGTWFYNVSSVTLGGKAVTYSANTSSSIVIALPATAASGSELVITTPGGLAKKIINFETVVIVSDFDGGGLRAASAWSAYGDVTSFSATTTGGPTGNFATFTWAGSTANGYNGSSGGNGGGPGVNFLPAASTDATRAFLDIDVSANVVGTNVAIQLNTIEGLNYGYNFKITDVNWATKTIKISDFKDNYGFGANDASALNVSKINEIKIGIAQGDSPNPSILKFDNIKVRYR